MKKVDKNTKERALKILSTAFKDNQGVLAVVKKDQHITRRSIELCNFCLTVSMQKDGAYITQDQKGVSLIFKSSKKQTFINWLKGYYRLGQYCIGWSRAIKIIRRDHEIQSRRPKKKHLYFWMLAVEDYTYGLETIKNMRDFVFQLSKEEQLSIYAEATSKKTLTLYKRYGFQVYGEWKESADGPTVYFIYRDWDS